MKKNFKAKAGKAPAASPFDVYQMVTDKILKQIEESGKLTWVKQWTAGNGHSNWPMNGKTRRRYDGVNFFLLQFSGFTSPYWLTFKQIEEMKGSIIKGSKATQIVFWKMNLYDEHNEATGQMEQKKVPMLRYYNVFNLEQTEGINILPIGPVTPLVVHEPIEISETVINEYGKLQPALKIRVQESPQAYYQPGADLVNMPVLGQFESPEAYYSTFFHELGHSTGHSSRLNRKEVMSNSSHFGSGDYGQEELTAELTAAFICAEIGISNETLERNSAAYLKHWKEAIKADKKMFIMAAGRANKAATLIMNRKEVTDEEIN